MDIPTLCPKCGETKDFIEFRHNPECSCEFLGKCDNMICGKCYWKLRKEVD